MNIEEIIKVYELTPTDLIVGFNNSTWSWEYDFSSMNAILILDRKNLNYKLVFISHKVKSGLGKGVWVNFHSEHNVGNLKKINKGLIRTLLQKYKNGNVSFRRNGWHNNDIFNATLNDVLNSNIIQRIVKINKLNLLTE